MACQIEALAGNIIERGGKSHSPPETDLEIVTLEQAYNEKILNGKETINGNISDHFEEAGSSTTNEIIENGHNKHDIDSEVDAELQSTPKKPSKGKKEKVSPKTSNKRTPTKKEVEQETKLESDYKSNAEGEASVSVVNDDFIDAEDNAELETTPTKSVKVKKSNRLTPSWRFPTVAEKPAALPLEDVELDYKKNIYDNDEDSTIDVGIDDPIGYDHYGSEKQESEDASGQQDAENTLFSRFRNTMRFSTNPEELSDYRKRLRELRAITGRRPLHETVSIPEPSVSRKRKLECDSADTPQSKYLITSFSERSPGWKFFTSPFHRLWSSKTSPENSTSTPMRELHEDVESMTVNVGDKIDDSLEVDVLEITTDEEEKDIDVQKKDIDKKSEIEEPQAKWKCIVM